MLSDQFSSNRVPRERDGIDSRSRPPAIRVWTDRRLSHPHPDRAFPRQYGDPGGRAYRASMHFRKKASDVGLCEVRRAA
jgi:hypothetical protein